MRGARRLAGAARGMTFIEVLVATSLLALVEIGIAHV